MFDGLEWSSVLSDKLLYLYKSMVIKLSGKLISCVYLLDDEEFDKILILGPRPIHENYAPRNLPLCGNSED